jgi:hypothetical protein
MRKLIFPALAALSLIFAPIASAENQYNVADEDGCQGEFDDDATQGDMSDFWFAEPQTVIGGD